MSNWSGWFCGFWSIELLNTAIEKLADRLTTDHDSQIGHIKDMGSAAVGVVLLIVGLTWGSAIAERMGLLDSIRRIFLTEPVSTANR